MKVSDAKIVAKTKELNKGQNEGPWIAIDGTQSLTTTEFNDGQAVFNVGSGVIVKLFMNRNDGELKMFPLNIFKE